MNPITLSQRLQQCSRSFLSLPLWVQIWVGGILIPVNAASFFMLDNWGAKMTALAALGVVITNIPIMLWEQGMSKLMAIPHLLLWGPLLVALSMRLAGLNGEGSVTHIESIYIWIVIVINGISVIFDALDTWKWIQGDRAVPGIES